MRACSASSSWAPRSPPTTRAALAIRPGDLRVHEHILNLLRPSCEPVARAPAAHAQAGQLRADAPAAPQHLAAQLDRAALEPDAVVLTDDLHAVAEVDALRADRRVDELGERGRHRAPLFQRTQDVLARRRV